MRQVENILEVTNLSKHFQDFSLRKVSFQLPAGYIMGFIGPNGAGKSTTIKLIMNLLHKDDGQIQVFGLDHIENETAAKDRIGFVYDENHFHEELSVRNMARIVAPFYSRWQAQTFEKYLKDFDLNPKQKIKELSKGMKLKFSLAIALSHQAELLIMDEPTAGLDPVVRTELLDILASLIEDERKAVFFSTHITSDLDKIADFVTFINNGQIVLSTTKDEILDLYGVVKGNTELLTPDARKLFIGLRLNKFGFAGLVRDKQAIRRLWQDSVVIERPLLEDLMLYTVRGERHA